MYCILLCDPDVTLMQLHIFSLQLHIYISLYNFSLYIKIWISIFKKQTKLFYCWDCSSNLPIQNEKKEKEKPISCSLFFFHFLSYKIWGKKTFCCLLGLLLKSLFLSNGGFTQAVYILYLWWNLAIRGKGWWTGFVFTGMWLLFSFLRNSVPELARWNSWLRERMCGLGWLTPHAFPQSTNAPVASPCNPLLAWKPLPQLIST